MRPADLSDEELLEKLDVACRLSAEVWWRHHAVVHDDLGRKYLGPEPTSVQARMFAHERKCSIAKKPCKMLVYKSRRHGASTCAQALLYHRGHRLRLPALRTMSYKDDSALEMHGLFKRLAEGDTFQWVPDVRNIVSDVGKKFTLSSGSEMQFLSAQSDEPGRSGAWQASEITEVAFYKETGAKDPLTAFMQSGNAAINDPLGLCIADSTPRGACYDDETDVLTDGGWKRLSELDGSERILTRDVATGRAYYQGTWKPQRFEWDGDLVEIEGKTVNLAVTPNHMMWVARQKGPMKFLRAEEMVGVKTTYVFDRGIDWRQPDADVFFLPSSRHRRGNGVQVNPSVEIPMDTWLVFLGHWLADGHLDTRRTKKEVIVTQTKFTKQFRASIGEIARRLGTEVREIKHGAGKRFSIYSTQLVEYLRDFYKPKRIGRELLMRLSRRQCRVLLDAIYEGDGCLPRRYLDRESDGGRVYAGIDREFQDDIQELAMKAGFAAKVYGAARARKTSFTSRTRAHVKNGTLPRVRHYRGMVYCVTLPKDHLLMVRRRGCAQWCGNSGWFYDMICGEHGVLKKKERGEWTLDDWEFIFEPWWTLPTARLLFNSQDEVDAFKRGLRHDEIEELEKWGEKGVTLEGLKWRRQTIDVALKGDAEKFKQEYPSDPLEGFLGAGRPKFNTRAIQVGLAQCDANDAQYERGSLDTQDDEEYVNNESATFRQDPGGEIEVMERPRFGLRYIVSMDTMTGEDQIDDPKKSEPDWQSVQLIRDEYTDELGRPRAARVVAKHRSRLDIYLAAELARSMAAWVGGCMIAVEVNNSGLAAVKYLEGKDANLYARRRLDRSREQWEKQLGWKTDSVTRKTIIDLLAKDFREGRIDPAFRSILREMLTFVSNKSGRYAALPGSFDDEVLALAIGNALRSEAQEYKRPTTMVGVGRRRFDSFQRVRDLR